MVDAHSAALNLCAFSPSGEYLASADLTGAVVVWAFDAGQPDASASLRTLDPIEVLQDLAWGRGPEDNYVVTLSLSDWAQAEAVPASHLSGGGGMPAQAQAQAGERGHSQGTGTGTQGGTQGTQGYTQTQGTQEEDIEAMDFLGESAPMPASSTANVTTSATTSTASATAPEEVVLGDAELAMIEAAEAAYTQQESAPAPAPTAPRPSVTFLPTPATATTTTAPTVTATAAPTTAPTTAATVPTAPIAPAPHKRLSKNGEGTAGDDEDDFLDEDSSPTTPEAVGGKTKVRDRDEDEDEDSINDEEADQVMDVDMAGVEAGMGGGMGVSGVEMRELLRLAQAVPKVQAAVLHPSSTRFDERNRRYLVWNNVGSIVLREEKVEGRVEIKFANTAGGNRNESFADHTGYVMAALSYEGALFASEADEDEGRDRDDFKKETAGSTLYYHAFPAQQQLGGANESFRWTLHNGESAVAVAAGRGWVAVATSRNLLYIYSAAGMPCGVFSLPGPAVSLSGSGARLAVVYRTHALHMDLYEINWQAGCRCAKLATCAMPMPDTRKDLEGPTSMLLTAGVQVVPKEQALAWLGFDVDNGLPVALDVQGMLWSLLRADGATWQWVPVLDVRTARKSSEHTYWPVTVRFGKLVYVLLNGESRPEIFPQPIVTTRSLRVPVPGVRDGKDVGEVQKERMHAIIWGSALTAHTEAQLGEALECKEPMEDPAVLEARVAQLQLEADKAVVKALQDACVRQRIPLALSLALQLRTEQAIQGAIQVANHFGRPTVAEALDRILEHRQALAALLEQQEEQQQYSNNNYQQEQEQQQEVEVEYVPAPRGGRREQQQQEEEQEEFGNMENEERPLGFLSSRLVSPQLPPPHPTPTHSSTSKPRNPFAVVSSGQTPVKRKSVFDGIQDLKASPSPKKPALGRQSTFSQQARQQRLSDKHIL
ncbi:hypothetical protein B484DRAFT_390699 [Ochromonadaceae sp. CCMP2298]|nr:hypothetical protein B484DRAFT_390699 [Ochromonadaceae sp. CCMP2298]